MRVLNHLLSSKLLFIIILIVGLYTSASCVTPTDGEGVRFYSEFTYLKSNYIEPPEYNFGFLLLLVCGIVAPASVTYILIILADLISSPFRSYRKKALEDLHHPGKIILLIADYLPAKPRKILRDEVKDLLVEYEEARTFGKSGRARIILILYHIGIAWAVFLWTTDKVKRVIKISKK